MSERDLLQIASEHLREGTEVLRTGGGIYLTSAECNAILDYINDLEDAAKELARVKFRQIKEGLDDNGND